MSAEQRQNYLRKVLFDNYTGEVPELYIGCNEECLSWSLLDEQFGETEGAFYDLPGKLIYLLTFIVQGVFLRWGLNKEIRPRALLSFLLIAFLHLLFLYIVFQFFSFSPQYKRTPDMQKYLEAPRWTVMLAVDQFCSNFYVLFAWFMMFLRLREGKDEYYRILVWGSIAVAWGCSLVSVYGCGMKVVFIDGEFVTVGRDTVVGMIINQLFYLISTATIFHWAFIRKIWTKSFFQNIHNLDLYDGILAFSILNGILRFLNDAAYYVSWSDLIILMFFKFYTTNFSTIKCAPLIILPMFIMRYTKPGYTGALGVRVGKRGDLENREEPEAMETAGVDQVEMIDLGNRAPFSATF